MRTHMMTPMMLLVLMLTLAGGMLASVAAQDTGTPAATGAMEDTTPRPAHIHAGTCPEVGDVVFPLGDLTGVTIQGSPVASPIVEDVDAPDIVQGEVVIESVTDVDAALDDILGAEHAVNVHESAQTMDVYIACGDVTGEPDDAGRLEIDMQELNASGFSGVAVFEDNGDGTTTVTVTLRDTGEGTTPAATPGA